MSVHERRRGNYVSPDTVTPKKPVSEVLHLVPLSDGAVLPLPKYSIASHEVNVALHNVAGRV